jgi:hypothetical protein
MIRLYPHHVTQRRKSATVAVIVLIAAFCIAALSGCGRDEIHKWRQKMTVEVDTPDGVVTGSNVVEVTWILGAYRAADGSSSDLKARGEAIALEVRPDKLLFVSIASAAYIPSGLYHGLGRAMPTSAGAADILKQPIGQKTEIPRQLRPDLLSFDDLTNPSSIRLLEHDDLDGFFGEGVRLKSIKLELTDEPVSSSSVGTLLRWLPTNLESSICPQGDLVNPPLCRSFFQRDFRSN